MKNNIYILAFIFLILESCSYFESKNTTKPLAKVSDQYLYENELPAEIFNEHQDSVSAVRRYVDQWALKHLLMQKAKFNLPQDDQEKYNQLVQNYKFELYTKAYKDALISEQTKNYKPSLEEIENYYTKHQETFRLNENLLQLRYVQLSKNLYNIDEIKKAFWSFNNEDQQFLEQRSLEFKNYSLNDSVWVREIDILKQFNTKVKRLTSNELALQSKIEIADSLGVALVYVSKRKNIKEQAPLSYVRPTIEQILLNKKKVELEKKIDKEVIEYAIENNEYQTFN